MKLKKSTSLFLAVSIAILFSSCSNPNTDSSDTNSASSAPLQSVTSSDETEKTEENNTSSLSSESIESSTSSTEDTSQITADTREELAKGLLKAVLADDKDIAKRYGVSNKNYTSMQEALTNGKEKAGMNATSETTVADFEIYITGPYKGGTCDPLESPYDKAFVYVISPTLPTVSFHFQITYDYDLEQYVLYSAFVDGMHYDKLLPRLENERPIQ